MKTAETRWNKSRGLWYTYIGPKAHNGCEIKKDAIAAGRVLARKRKVEHLVKNKDGTISFRNSYGNDPRGRG